MRNFGHDGPEKFNGVGINGKNSEVHAAMGLVNLNHIETILTSRKKLSMKYDQTLKNLVKQNIVITPGSEFNFAYYPIILPTEEATLKSIESLNANLIYPRRYFYPCLSELEYVSNSNVETATSIAKRVICLPLYHTLSNEEIDFIARILLRVQNN